MTKDNPDILHEMNRSCSFNYARTTINFCIALGWQLWKDFRILNGIVASYIFMYACAHVYGLYKVSNASLVALPHCLPNQVRFLDYYSLTIGEPSTSRARRAFPSLFEIWDKRDMRFFSRVDGLFPVSECESKRNYFSTPYGTVQRSVQLHLDTVSSECSYAKINRQKPDVREKREIRGTFLPICIRRLWDFR